MNMISSTRPKRASFTAAGALGAFLGILPQNGVVDGSIHYDGNSAPRRESPSSMELRNGSFKGSEIQPRPSVLGVNTPNIAKRVRDDHVEVEGSLPCTPDSQSDIDMDVTGFPAQEEEVLENDTRQQIDAFLKGFVGNSKPKWKPGKVQETMRRVVKDVLEKHQYAYNGMIKKLQLDKREDDMSFVTSVAKSLFADGTTNWGRIASLLAFGAAVCQYLKERHRDHCVELVGQEISTYLLSDQRDWLVKNKSWDGFVEFFRVADPETTVRNTLMAFAGVAGIGATLALLIR